MGEVEIEAMRRRRMREALEGSFDALPGGVRSLSAFDGGRILASGCTGFFGIWIHAGIESLVEGGSKIELLRLSRSPEAFDAAHPRWAGAPWAGWIRAGAGEFADLDPGAFSHGLHMAGSSDAAGNAADPAGMALSAAMGSAGMASLCARSKARLLMCSSGAVYGRRSSELGPAKESDVARSAPDPLDGRLCYGSAKRVAESLCAALGAGAHWTVARPFAFLGPWLPLSAHFAAGNFLRDAASGRAVEVKGDGRPVRSYMHPADMAAWMLWLAANGPRGEAVNVGSDRAVTIARLAQMAAGAAGAPAPVVSGAGAGDPDCYLPDLAKATGLGLRAAHGLEWSVESSLEWLAATGGVAW